MPELDEVHTDEAAVPSNGRTQLLAALALLALTAAWGSTFFMIKDLLDRVPTLDFLAVRFTIAAVVLFAVAPRAVARLPRAAKKHAVVLGLLYGVAQVLQTAGLAHTDASVSGFVTGMYVVLTPVLASWILRTRVNAVTWGAVALATLGLGILTLTGFSLGVGESITFLAAILYALHIVGLGAWSTPEQALGMTTLQMVVIAALCLVSSAPGGIVLPERATDWLSVLYMAVVVGAIGLLAQTWAQAHLPPTRSAIIMSMEPVFASLFAIWLGGEHATSRLLIGGAMVVVAMVVVELPSRRKIEGEVPHIAV